MESASFEGNGRLDVRERDYSWGLSGEGLTSPLLEISAAPQLRRLLLARACRVNFETSRAFWQGRRYEDRETSITVRGAALTRRALREIESPMSGRIAPEPFGKSRGIQDFSTSSAINLSEPLHPTWRLSLVQGLTYDTSTSSVLLRHLDGKTWEEDSSATAPLISIQLSSPLMYPLAQPGFAVAPPPQLSSLSSSLSSSLPPSSSSATPVLSLHIRPVQLSRYAKALSALLNSPALGQLQGTLEGALELRPLSGPGESPAGALDGYCRMDQLRIARSENAAQPASESSMPWRQILRRAFLLGANQSKQTNPAFTGGLSIIAEGKAISRSGSVSLSRLALRSPSPAKMQMAAPPVNEKAAPGAQDTSPAAKDASPTALSPAKPSASSASLSGLSSSDSTTSGAAHAGTSWGEIVLEGIFYNVKRGFSPDLQAKANYIHVDPFLTFFQDWRSASLEANSRANPSGSLARQPERRRGAAHLLPFQRGRLRFDLEKVRLHSSDLDYAGGLLRLEGKVLQLASAQAQSNKGRMTLEAAADLSHTSDSLPYEARASLESVELSVLRDMLGWGQSQWLDAGMSGSIHFSGRGISRSNLERSFLANSSLRFENGRLPQLLPQRNQWILGEIQDLHGRVDLHIARGAADFQMDARCDKPYKEAVLRGSVKSIFDHPYLDAFLRLRLLTQVGPRPLRSSGLLEPPAQTLVGMAWRIQGPFAFPSLDGLTPGKDFALETYEY